MNAELSLIFQERQDKIPNVREIVAEYFTLTPRHMGKLKISMEPVDKLYVSIESHWMSKWLRLLIPFEGLYNDLFNNTDGYYAMNFMTSYMLSQNLNVFFKATNLFDEKYGSLNATFIDESLEQVLKLLSLSSPMNYEIVPAKKNKDNSYGRRRIILVHKE